MKKIDYIEWVFISLSFISLETYTSWKIKLWFTIIMKMQVKRENGYWGKMAEIWNGVLSFSILFLFWKYRNDEYIEENKQYKLDKYT